MSLRRWPIILFLLVVALATIRLVTTLADPGSDDGGYADFRDTIHAPAVAVRWMLAAAFNPLTIRFLRIGRGLDTITSLFLVAALLGLATGILRATSRSAPATAGRPGRLAPAGARGAALALRARHQKGPS